VFLGKIREKYLHILGLQLACSKPKTEKVVKKREKCLLWGIFTEKSLAYCAVGA
jgi:hypothetical protein